MTDEDDGRALLERIGEAVAPTRILRNLPDRLFDDVTREELVKAARALRALSYSCHQGAIKLEWIAKGRRGE